MTTAKDFLETLPDSQYGFIYHYYRAEVYRETNWRNRLDVTINWAIGTTGAILSFVFSNPQLPHTVIIMNFFIVLFFLYSESRRFRYYQILKARTKLLERNLLNRIFSDKSVKKDDDHSWVTQLHDSLTNPTITMSRTESISWRLRRNYIFLLPIIYLTWIVKITTSPIPVRSIGEMLANARMWVIPGTVVVGIFTAILVYLIIIAITIPRQSEEDDLP